MSAPEATCRLFGVPVVKLSHNILPLYIHSEEEGPTVTFTEGEEEAALGAAERSMQEGRKSTLTAYFKLCADPDEERAWKDVEGKKQGPPARELRYDQIPFYYIWVKVGSFYGWSWIAYIL